MLSQVILGQSILSRARGVGSPSNHPGQHQPRNLRLRVDRFTHDTVNINSLKLTINSEGISRQHILPLLLFCEKLQRVQINFLTSKGLRMRTKFNVYKKKEIFDLLGRGGLDILSYFNQCSVDIDFLISPFHFHCILSLDLGF